MGKTRIKILIILAILPFFAFGVHKYYISLTEVEYVPEKASLQIISRYFIDDLEFALEKEYSGTFQLNTVYEIDSVDNYFKKYLAKNILFNINSSPHAFNYIGKEYEDDIVYFYLEITQVDTLHTLEVKNTSLFKYFPDQQNVVKTNINNKHTSFYLNKQKDKGLLKF
ncbi:MAG: peptidase E [Flavobacteriaceae bacterium]|nr:MAG: peptidase E [Flavobacteriaceae bacterium]